MKSGNIYWAAFKAALYAVGVTLASSDIRGCGNAMQVHEHNCRTAWSKHAADLASRYETNMVVKAVKAEKGKKTIDMTSAKLLLHKEAAVKFGADYDLSYAEFEPCPKHGGSARIYYTMKAKEARP